MTEKFGMSIMMSVFFVYLVIIKKMKYAMVEILSGEKSSLKNVVIASWVKLTIRKLIGSI